MGRGGSGFRLSANGVPIKRATTLEQIGRRAAEHFGQGFSTPLIVTETWHNHMVTIRRHDDGTSLRVQLPEDGSVRPTTPWFVGLVQQLRLNNLTVKEVAT